MKVGLFYLIHTANSNSCEKLGIFVRFQCFCPIFNLSSGETVKTTTDQRNLSIIGSDDVHISS